MNAKTAGIPDYSADALTLEQAISLLRSAEDGAGEIEESMAEVEQAFLQHDAVHAIFGLGTSVEDEIAAHVWMAMATNAKLREMHQAVSQAEHRKILDGIGHGRLLATWLRRSPRLLGIALRSLRMTRRIDFAQIGRLKAMTLGDIRAEHGVRLQ